jgi:hypothetical protein
MDITYIPMAQGFVYLAVVLDWFKRHAMMGLLPKILRHQRAWSGSIPACASS